MKRLALLLALIPAVAAAQVIPTEEEKVEALKQAYSLNGNSMVSRGYMIDLTDPAVQKADKIVTTVAVPPVVVPPVADAKDKNEIDEQADLNMKDLHKFSRRANMKTDICARYGMHKVVTGSSWRCRK